MMLTVLSTTCQIKGSCFGEEVVMGHKLEINDDVAIDSVHDVSEC